MTTETPPSFWRAWGVAALVLLLADAVWLGLLMDRVYADQIGHLMRPQPLWGAALLFYLLYPVGLVRLVMWPPGLSATLSQAAWRGACVGLLAYGTYDLSNLATLRGWPLGLSLIDMLWGAGVSALSAAAAWRMTRS